MMQFFLTRLAINPALRTIALWMLAVSSFAFDYSAEAQKSDVIPFVDLGYGLAIHQLPGSDGGAASGVIKTAVGMQWLSFVSAQVGLWHWRKRNNTAQSRSSTETPRSNIQLDGISALWELTLQLPIASQRAKLSYGPFYRFGRHCWAAVISGLAQPWAKDGCSDIHSLGVVLPISSRMNDDLVWYIEGSDTDLEGISSRSVQIGAKLAF